MLDLIKMHLLAPIVVCPTSARHTLCMHAACIVEKMIGSFPDGSEQGLLHKKEPSSTSTVTLI